MYSKIIKNMIQNLIKGGKLFHQKKGMTLASSSSFYALITMVPFLLLMVRGIGYFLGSLSRTEKYLFILGSKFFPDMAPELLVKLQGIIKGPLFAEGNFTLLNFIFLAISTITFINSIWMGIYFITDDKKVLSWTRILKGFVIIGITLLMVAIVFIIPPIIIFIIKFLQSNPVTQYLLDNFDFIRPYLNFLLKVNLKKSYWLNSNLLHLAVVLVYFSLLYRWLFSWKISFKESVVAAMAFSFSMFVGKSIFWIYIYYVRNGLVKNYGDLYTSVVGVIWIFYLMCFFFYGACVCQVYRERLHISNRKY